MKMFSGLMPSGQGLPRAGSISSPWPEVGGEGDDLRLVFGLQPLEDDRGVEAAGIGEHDLLHGLASHEGVLPGNTKSRRASSSKKHKVAGRLARFRDD
jgi:hypothetical protein